MPNFTDTESKHLSKGFGRAPEQMPASRAMESELFLFRIWIRGASAKNLTPSLSVHPSKFWQQSHPNVSFTLIPGTSFTVELINNLMIFMRIHSQKSNPQRCLNNSYGAKPQSRNNFYTFVVVTWLPLPSNPQECGNGYSPNACCRCCFSSPYVGLLRT
jgi:hypothetical protein